jgi:hypothetical protein
LLHNTAHNYANQFEGPNCSSSEFIQDARDFKLIVIVDRKEKKREKRRHIVIKI